MQSEMAKPIEHSDMQGMTDCILLYVINHMIER